MKYPLVLNQVGGGPVPFDGEHAPEVSPLDGSLLSNVPRSGVREVAAAVRAAAAAFPAWAGRTLKQRAQVAYRYREVLLRDIDQLGRLIHEENGKTIDEGRAEVVRAVEVTEFACSLPQASIASCSDRLPGS